MRARSSSTPPRGFTIIEMLAVVGIIVLLMALLFPAIGMVQRSSRAEVSKSNLRQWGVGTIGYINLNQDALPWEGMKDIGDMPLNLQERRWWANAIPPFVGQKPYRDIVEDAYQKGTMVPTEDSGGIFIDPAAVHEGDAPFAFGQPGPSGARRSFYFNYVPNSQLNNTYLNKYNIAQFTPNQVMRMSHISIPSSTILMLEMRANRNELPGNDPHFNRDLRRHRSDWKRFAARHFNGGHMMFADGSVRHVVNLDAITNIQGNTDPNFPNGDWNHPDRIWDPLGPALDDN
ncbi:MAG: type II secretion system protein [Phycisphaeraceae bacterium]|nr:type II secretion system protein [Phycisphaeraceae bacterium]